ncbi:VanZ family protein [Paenibacillus sp. FSL W8-0919]|uniref:VanZ family protein n=1 Tax=Paenibacillus sp. FSL W8-0919 TaxID=2954707 RepID=UPI0030F52CBB
MDLLYTIPPLAVLIPLALLYIIFRVITYKNKRVTLLEILFSGYSLGVIYFVFLPIELTFGVHRNQAPWYSSINFIPILTIDMTSFILNIILFIPLGAFLWLAPRTVYSLKQAIRTGLSVSFGIELMQLIIKLLLGSSRSIDINDLIANTIGCVVGYFLIKQAIKFKPFASLLKWLLPINHRLYKKL